MAKVIDLGFIKVVTSGTRVPLSTNRLNAAWISVQAVQPTGNNVGPVYLGDVTVVKSSTFGFKLISGDSFFFPWPGGQDSYNLAAIYIDADNSNDGVMVMVGQI